MIANINDCKSCEWFSIVDNLCVYKDMRCYKKNGLLDHAINCDNYIQGNWVTEEVIK